MAPVSQSKAKHAFKPPAFQLYAKEFLQDEAVIAMDLEAVGAYIILLCHQWNEGSIPSDPAMLARICRTTVERIEKIWPQVAVKFAPVRHVKNRLVNPKLETIRAEKMRFSHNQSKFGHRGAQKKWESKTPEKNGLNGLAHRDPVGSAWGSDGSGSGTGSVIHKPHTPSGEGGAENSLELLPSEPNGKHATESERKRWFEEQFWPVVWAKIGIDAARKAWARKVPDLATCTLVVEAAKRQGPAILERGRHPGSSVLHPATWLNQGRYLDEEAASDASAQPARRLMAL